MQRIRVPRRKTLNDGVNGGLITVNPAERSRLDTQTPRRDGRRPGSAGARQSWLTIAD